MKYDTIRTCIEYFSFFQENRLGKPNIVNGKNSGVVPNRSWLEPSKVPEKQFGAGIVFPADIMTRRVLLDERFDLRTKGGTIGLCLPREMFTR